MSKTLGWPQSREQLKYFSTNYLSVLPGTKTRKAPSSTVRCPTTDGQITRRKVKGLATYYTYSRATDSLYGVYLVGLGVGQVDVGDTVAMRILLSPQQDTRQPTTLGGELWMPPRNESERAEVLVAGDRKPNRQTDRRTMVASIQASASFHPSIVRINHD